MKFRIITLVLVACFGLGNIALSQDNRNYVSPTDSALKISLKYDNPMRSAYQLGFNIGADVSTFSGGVFGEVTASASPKFCTVKASYAFDLSNGDFISKSTLLNYGNKYGNMQAAAVFNFKDNTTSNNVKPTIGYRILDRSTSGNTTTTKYNEFYTDYEVKTRKTTGVGLSFNTLSTNSFYMIDKVDSTAEFVKLKNGAAMPNEFILPYNSAILGVS
ncbi:MAG: hypothetical protein KDC92_11390, partial [Bacteroidetes bacterium]|nr:hypothetical protein [Bacteroidota bacterium]